MLDQDGAHRARTPLLLVQSGLELLLVDQGPLEELAADDRVRGDTGGVPRLGDAAGDEADVDEALGALDVERAEAPHPAQDLQDLNDPERVKRPLHAPEVYNRAT